MTTTVRFPFPSNTVNHASEANQILTLLAAQATISLGGGVTLGESTAAWKTAGVRDEAPYTDVMIEFFTDAAVIIGDGNGERIGLYGELAPPAAINTRRVLLGVLGMNLGGTTPQIPIVAASGSGELVGYAQLVCNIAQYDRIGIGSVSGADIAVGADLTVTARPIRKRIYGG